MTIEPLPVEILLHIFENLDCSLPTKESWMGDRGRASRITLKSLCLTCHTFRNVAQPLLFRNILMDNTEDGAARFICLANVLADKPAMGLYTRSLSVPHIVPWEAPLADFSPENLRHRVLNQPDLSPRLKACLDKFCPAGRRFNPAAFCLAFMPNLQVSLLDTEAPEKFDNDQNHGQEAIDERVLMQAFANLGLHNLKEYRCHDAQNRGAIDATNLDGVVLHPGVRIVRSVGVDWRGRTAFRQQWPHLKSNLRVLDLKECIIDGPGLDKIFQRYPLLEELSIELGDVHRAIWVEDDNWSSELPEIGPVLKKHGTRLVKLDLHTVEYTHAFGDGFLGSIQELDNIRHLGVLKDDLTGHNTYSEDDDNSNALQLKEVLPRSIETLYLHYDSNASAVNDLEREGINREIYDVITGGEFPSLREVKVERFMGDDQPFGFTVKGWTSEMRREHLWKRRSSSGCERTVMVLSRV